MPATVEPPRPQPITRRRPAEGRVAVVAAGASASTALAAGARAGRGDMVPVAIAMLPFAMVLGVAIEGSVVPDAAGLLFAPILYAGASHFAVMSILDGGGSAVTAVMVALIVNARFAVYGAALAGRFRRQPTWFRWLGPWLIVDQTFALASSREETDLAWFRGYWTSAGLVLGGAFTAAVLAGIILGPVVPSELGLAFTFPALFLALLVGNVRDHADALAALTGALVTALALGLPHGLGLVAGALAGAAAGLITQRVS